MARHAVAVACTVLIHALLGLVGAMPGPAAPSRGAGPRLQCPTCLKGFSTDANFRRHQAAMAKSDPRGCGRYAENAMPSGWSGGSRPAGTVADLSGQRQAARLPGIDDSDSDSSGGGGRRQMDQDGGDQDHPTAADSEEEAGPAVPDASAGDGGAEQAHTYKYTHTSIYSRIPDDTAYNHKYRLILYRYIQIPTYTRRARTWSAYHSVTDQARHESVPQYLYLDTMKPGRCMLSPRYMGYRVKIHENVNFLPCLGWMRAKTRISLKVAVEAKSCMPPRIAHD